MDNYCYLRCRNNTDSPISTAKAQLFYTTASVVTWPDFWTAMPVDFSDGTVNSIVTANGDSIPAGGIGVVQRPFVWKRPKAPDVNDHYCFIGRLFTDQTPNPVPSVQNPVQMTDIIKHNLMYAQRNISIVDEESLACGAYSVLLNASAQLTKPSKFHLFFYPHNLVGWKVRITVSQKDSTGRMIGISERDIVDNNDIYCGQCLLEPGFTALASVYLYNPNKLPIQDGASTNIALEYAAVQNELLEFSHPEVLRFCLSRNAKRSARIDANLKNEILAPVGSHNMIIKK